MTFEKAKEEIAKCSSIGIRRPCWKDKTLRITGDKQFAGTRIVHKGEKSAALIQIAKDLQYKQETIYDGSDLFYQTDNPDFLDSSVYNNQIVEVGFNGEGLPCGKEDYLAKDWEIYMPNNLESIIESINEDLE